MTQIDTALEENPESGNIEYSNNDIKALLIGQRGRSGAPFDWSLKVVGNRNNPTFTVLDPNTGKIQLGSDQENVPATPYGRGGNLFVKMDTEGIALVNLLIQNLP